MDSGTLPLAAALAVTALAAVADLRTGRIPNALTGAGFIAGLVMAVLVAPARPLEALGVALLGAALSAVVPAIMWRAGTFGGGDVKLLAAVGAILGPSLGIATAFAAFAFATAYVVLRRAFFGDLLVTLANAVALTSNVFRSRRGKVAPRPSLTETMCFGPWTLAGALFVAATHGGLS